jgi:hypothetical protein
MLILFGLPSLETIEGCDTKNVRALDHILKKWKMDHIPLPIKLVHSDIVSTDDTPMNYEPPNTVIVDDSNEFVQFLYNDGKDLRTNHEVLAIMLAFVLVDMMQSSSAIKPYSREAFRKVFTAKIEVEKFLQETYARPTCYL